MKSAKLFIAALFICSLFAVSPAKASTGSNTQSSGLFSDIGDWFSSFFGSHSGSSGSGSTGSGSTGKGGTSLPIDNQVWFLIVAAGVVGCKVIINNSKKLETQTSNI